MNRIAVTLLLCCTLSLFAGVRVLEQKPGHIKLEVTAQPFQLTEILDSVRLDGEGDATMTNASGEEVPAFSFSIFTDNPSKAKLTYSIEGVTTYSLPRPIIRGEAEPTLSQLSEQYPIRMRNATIHRWDLSPVLSTKNGQIKQITKAIITITYPPVKQSQKPTSPYYKTMAKLALNPDEFFTVAPQRTPQAVSSRASRAATGSYLAINERAAYFTVAGDPANETETNGDIDGLYKVTPSSISQILGQNLPMSSISIYSTNPLVCDPVTPDVDSLPDALLPVPAIYRDLNNDGIFNNNDEILFYATGMHYWQLESRKWEYRFNDFTEERHFYVRTTQGSNPIEILEQPTGAVQAKNSGLQLIRTKKSNDITTDTKNQGYADRQWKWATIDSKKHDFTPGTELGISPKYAPEMPSALRVLRDITKSSYGDDAIYTFSLSTGRDSIFTKASKDALNNWIPLPIETNTFELKITNFPNDNDKYTDIIGYDIAYYRQLDMSGISKLRFYSDEPSVSAPVVTYSVSNEPSNYSVVIRNHPETQEMFLVDSSSTFASSLTWSDSTGKGYEYVVASASGATVPTFQRVISTAPNASSSEFLVRDLRSVANRSDYMIVTPTALLNSSIEIAKHKKSVGTFLNPTVVTTEDIYREFSGGVSDPTAIRNFMTYAYHKWQKPLNGDDNLTYLLLVGAGHYNYKEIKSTGSNPNYIPPYIVRTPSTRPSVEDFFGLVQKNDKPTASPRPSIAVGRIQANSSSDVDNFLTKLKYMESGIGDFTEWRNRLLFVADDDLQGSEYETIRHWDQSDGIAEQTLKNSPTSHIQKVTLFEYEKDGVQKPGAKLDLLDRINNGVSLMNFFGHGGFRSMTDEGIFDFSDLLVLKNERRYLIFLAFSCSVGFFDQPGKECLSAKMVTIADKGAHSAISSTRTSYASSNYNFATTFYDEMFSPDKQSSIGLSYLVTKQKHPLVYYAIFGDPSYTPLMNNRNIQLDIQDENGNSIDTLKAVQQVRVKATISSDHTVDSVRLHLENPEQLNVRRKDGFADYNPKLKDTIEYDLPGKILLNQVFPVVDGKLDALISIPPIVLQKEIGTKLRAYGWCNDSSSTVTGLKDSLYFDGIDYANLDTTDKTGPNITIRLAQDSSEADTALPGSVGNRVVIDGFYIDTEDSTDVSQAPAIVELFFSDSSGIDIFGENVGEGITISLKDVRTAKNYNGSFRSINESRNKGKVTLSFSYDEFPRPGEYELIVTAADYNKNVTKERFIIEVKSLQQGLYDIGEFYAYPSPAHIGEHTRFYFNTPDFRVHRMTLKIFTLSGQLVRQFNDVRPGVNWDLKDQRGNQLSPDVYLYRLYVERDARESTDFISTEREKEIITSPIRKMVIYPPR